MAENTSNKKIWLASPHISDEGYEMQFVQEAFDTNWVAPLGPNVNEFEKELAAKVGSKICCGYDFWYRSNSLST